MTSRTFTIAGAAALWLGLCAPAEAFIRAGIIANGTQLDGIVPLNVTQTQQRAEDLSVALGGLCQAEGICPKNGTQLNGITPESFTSKAIPEELAEQNAAPSIGGLCQLEGICPKNGTQLTGLALPPLVVDGAEFIIALPDGTTRRSADLIGVPLKARVQGRAIEVTIRSVEEDRHAVGGRVVLHRFTVNDASGRATDLCTADPEGRKLGFPVPDGRGGFDLTCTSGVVGKCIRWGYRHWEEQPGGPPLRALHRACVHMARADYGGDGTPSTRDGTLIDIHDRFGIQRFDRHVPMTFEAAWGVDGAVCVARPRIAENISLAQVAERYPHLASRLGDACSEESALRDPATLLFNRSRS